jgi:hypothetical protein
MRYPPGLDDYKRPSPVWRHGSIATLFHEAITMREREMAMRLIIGLALIVLGLGVMGWAGYIYLIRYDGLSSNPHVIVAFGGQAIDIGHHLDGSAQAAIIGLIAAGLIGLILFSAGILTLLRRMAGPAPGVLP